MGEKKALLFNIQKFSLHDGPGIRTTVFFKGCPLRCQWCSNPESQSGKVQVTWDAAKCIGCGKCISECPENAISRIASKEPGGFEYVVDANKCIGCGICAGICPSGIWAMYNNAEAINMYKVI